MTGIANALEEPTIADVAAYYAGQPKRNPNPATLGELPESIVRLVELGDPSRNIPPCAARKLPTVVMISGCRQQCQLSASLPVAAPAPMTATPPRRRAA